MAATTSISLNFFPASTRSLTAGKALKTSIKLETSNRLIICLCGCSVIAKPQIAKPMSLALNYLRLAKILSNKFVRGVAK